jgi:hypothetical protein
MAKPESLPPKCIIVARPNGAGKTTFAREFLAQEAGVVHFVNPDLIATGSRHSDQNLLGSPPDGYCSVSWIGWSGHERISRSKAL